MSCKSQKISNKLCAKWKTAYIRRTLLKHKSPVQLRGWWGEAKGDHDLRSLTFNALPKKRDWNISWSGIKAWWLVKKSETWPFPRSRGRKGRPYRSRKKVSSQDWQTRARIGPFSMDIDFQKLEWFEGSKKETLLRGGFVFNSRKLLTLCKWLFVRKWESGEDSSGKSKLSVSLT